MARADIHVFGSVSGYGTVAASSGLRADETQELERFQFGEISTSDAIARLESHPTMTARPLASGRMAISRMLPAGVDDAGRPTIEVVTLVVDARVYEGNLGALEILTSDASWWRSARANARSGATYPSGSAPTGDPRDIAMLRILDAWMYAKQSGSVAILPDSALPELLRFVATLDASDRVSCRWGVGINSLSAPVDIAIMMSGASTHGARAAVRPAQAGQWYVGETEFAQFRASAGGAVWIPTSEMIRGASAPIGGDGAANAAGAGGAASAISYAGSLSGGRVWDERQKRAVVGSAIAAVCATVVLAIAGVTYLNASSKRSSAIAVLAQGESGGDVDRMPARPGRAGKPGASRNGEVVARQSPRSEAEPEGAAGGEEAAKGQSAPDSSTKTLETSPTMVVLYRDKDGDGYGVETDTHHVEEGTSPLPNGWVDKAGDECPDDKDRQKRGPCDCIAQKIEEIDYDGDGVSDCKQDDDCDGVLNFLSPGWNHKSELRPLLKKLKYCLDESKTVKNSVDDVSCIRGDGEAFTTFIERVAANASGIATLLNEVAVDLFTAQTDQAALSKSGTGFPFVQELWAAKSTKGVDNCHVLQTWKSILDELCGIAGKLDELQGCMQDEATKFRVGGNNRKDDFTRGDAKEVIHREWNKVKEELKGASAKMLDEKALQKERAQVEKLIKDMEPKQGD